MDIERIDWWTEEYEPYMQDYQRWINGKKAGWHCLVISRENERALKAIVAKKEELLSRYMYGKEL